MITKSDPKSFGIISWLWHGLVAQISRAKFSANKAIKKYYSLQSLAIAALVLAS
jgi:hypothetical protein